jgi:UDP-N-acetylglucosamine enolpyruvyl transferase
MGMANADRFRVVGGARLHGEVTISGAKNSALKLMAATLLAPGRSTISNVPDIADVEIIEIPHGESYLEIMQNEYEQSINEATIWYDDLPVCQKKYVDLLVRHNLEENTLCNNLKSR